MKFPLPLALSTGAESEDVYTQEKPRLRRSSVQPVSSPSSPRTIVPPQRYAYETFHRGKQLRHMIFWTFCRWLLTAALALSIFGVIWSYSQHEALPATKKNEFNSLVIGLSIAYSLNLASALKRDASYLRWWLLSLQDYSPREADLILQCENLSGLLKLGWMSRHASIQAFVFLFLVLNISAQVALALLGITYNINPAEKMSVTKPGMVYVTDMTSIQLDRTFAQGTPRADLALSQTENARRYSANTFGLSSLTMLLGGMENVPEPGKFYDPRDPVLFMKDLDGQPAVYTYYFYEASTENSDYFAMVATNRSISTTSNCTAYKVLAGGDGLSQNITVLWEDNEKMNYTLPSINGPDQTMYIHDPEFDAGDTWALVFAFEASVKDPWFYACNTTINPVTNAIIKEHEVSPNVTRYAAAAIALQGYGSSAFGLTNDTKYTQFQSYPFQVEFGQPCSGNVMLMSMAGARFSIGTIAAVANSNNFTEVRGMAPMRSITLEITDWTTLYLILGLTVGLQLLFSVSAVIVANTVQLRGHSHLAMAALLSGSLSKLDETAQIASGKEIAAMMGQKARMRYEQGQGGGGYHVMVS